MERNKRESLIYLTISILFYGIMFYIDIITPFGYSAWLAYAAPIIILNEKLSDQKIYMLTLLSILLILVGWFLKPLDLYETISIINRSLGIILFITIVSLQVSRKHSLIQLKNLLKERETLLKEIHHRIKNNFQMIASLLSLQLNNIKDPEIVNILKLSKNNIKSMALVHEKMYKSTDFSSIDSGTYLREITQEMFKVYNAGHNISLVMEIESIKLNSNNIFLLGLIINELISNSIKHAFGDSEKGKIKITLTQKTGIIKFQFHDNGKGNMTGSQSTYTLGMELISAFTEQLQGELRILNNNGYQVDITFPDDTI